VPLLAPVQKKKKVKVKSKKSKAAAWEGGGQTIDSPPSFFDASPPISHAISLGKASTKKKRKKKKSVKRQAPTMASSLDSPLPGQLQWHPTADSPPMRKNFTMNKVQEPPENDPEIERTLSAEIMETFEDSLDWLLDEAQEALAGSKMYKPPKTSYSIFNFLLGSGRGQLLLLSVFMLIVIFVAHRCWMETAGTADFPPTFSGAMWISYITFMDVGKHLDISYEEPTYLKVICSLLSSLCSPLSSLCSLLSAL
jgi:hypothetical protein